MQPELQQNIIGFERAVGGEVYLPIAFGILLRDEILQRAVGGMRALCAGESCRLRAGAHALNSGCPI